LSESLQIYVNGVYRAKEHAYISVYDHGLFYGDGVFEAIRAYDGVIFKLDEHLVRLYESAKSLRIDIGMTIEEMRDVVLETLRRNRLREAYIRIIVTRGEGPMGVDPRNCDKPTVVVIAEPRKPTFGSGEKGIKAIVSSVRRIPRDCIDPQIKTLNYINQILAKIEAIDAGVEEAIMLNAEGFVAEASTENVFLVKKGRVITPHPTAGILNGITRQTIIEICQELGIEVIERNVTIHELYNADEVFVTGTGAEIVHLSEISGRKIADGRKGPITKRIEKRFREITKDPEHGLNIDIR